MTVTPDRHQAWRLVQIADLLRRSQRAHEQALDNLDQIDTAALAHASIALDRASELETLGETIGDLALQIRVLMGDLSDATLETGPEDLVAAAAADLAGGIFDEARLLLAARVLPVGQGWRALACALRSTDAHWEWETTTTGWLLGSFRDAQARDVERVLAVAQLSAGACFATCDDAQLLRLAAALEREP